jgi:hypothetical protein
MTVFLVGYNTSGSGGGLLSLVPIATGVDWNQSNAITYNFSTNAGELYTTFNFNATSFNVNRTFASSPLLFTHVQNGTATTLFAYGSNYSTGTLTMGTTTGLSIGARFQGGNGTANAFLTGQVNEVLLFSNALTTAQRQQVEGYLAAKWGLASSLPATHPFKLAPPIMRAFLPTDVLAPTFWLDAADATTFTLSGSAITQWRDKSSSQFTGTSSGSPVQGTLNGRPAVAFNGSQVFDFGDVADLGSANLNMFVVCQFTTTGTGSVIAKSLYGDAQLRYSLLRESGSLLVLLQGDGGGAAPGVADTSTAPRLLSWTWDRTTQTLYLNGTSALSAPFANTATFNSSYKLLIGGYNNGNGGTPPMSFLAFNGTIGEVLFLFGTLTTVQRQQVEGYLAQKWGLGSSLPTTHPYRSVLPSTPLFAPPLLSGLTLWLDAADRTTLFQDSGGTQPVTTVGQSIGLWRDKSSRGYLMTVPSGRSAPTYGQNVINTSGTNALWSTTNFELTGNAKLTLFFVFASSVASGFNTSCAAWVGNPNGAVAGKIIGLGIAVQGLPDNYVYFVPSTFSSAELSSSQPRLVGVTTLTMAKYDGTTVFGNYNGTSLAPAGIVAAGGANWSALPFQTGMRSANAGGSADGFMCEVLCYNDALSDLQIQQVEGYLAAKWGLQARLPASHPFAKIRP